MKGPRGCRRSEVKLVGDHRQAGGSQITASYSVLVTRSAEQHLWTHDTSNLEAVCEYTLPPAALLGTRCWHCAPVKVAGEVSV